MLTINKHEIESICSSYGYSYSQFENAFKPYWPYPFEWCVALALSESGMNPRAVNRFGAGAHQVALGLFQQVRAFYPNATASPILNSQVPAFRDMMARYRKLKQPVDFASMYLMHFMPELYEKRNRFLSTARFIELTTDRKSGGFRPAQFQFVSFLKIQGKYVPVLDTALLLAHTARFDAVQIQQEYLANALVSDRLRDISGIEVITPGSDEYDSARQQYSMESRDQKSSWGPISHPSLVQILRRLPELLSAAPYVYFQNDELIEDPKRLPSPSELGSSWVHDADALPEVSYNEAVLSLAVPIVQIENNTTGQQAIDELVAIIRSSIAAMSDLHSDNVAYAPCKEASRQLYNPVEYTAASRTLFLRSIQSIVDIPAALPAYLAFALMRTVNQNLGEPVPSAFIPKLVASSFTNLPFQTFILKLMMHSMYSGEVKGFPRHYSLWHRDLLFPYSMPAVPLYPVTRISTVTDAYQMLSSSTDLHDAYTDLQSTASKYAILRQGEPMFDYIRQRIVTQLKTMPKADTQVALAINELNALGSF